MKPYFETELGKLYHGDCLEIIPQIEEEIDLILTDPPYSSGGTYRADRNKSTAQKYQHTHETNRNYATFSGDNRDQRSFEKWCYLWMSYALNKTREGGVIGCFIDWRNIACVVDAVQVSGWIYRGIVPWYKGSDQRPRKAWFRQNVEYIVFGSLGPLQAGPDVEGICQDGFLNHRINGIEKEHQTQKPVEVFLDVIGIRPDWKCILDPFIGSGSTALACERLNRKWVGIEIAEANCEIVAKRIMRKKQQPELWGVEQSLAVDRKGRAGKLVAESAGLFAPALSVN
jgi:site-specific DNA-methyltransferase (adenine-specific)